MSAPVCSTAVRAPRAVELIGAPSDCGANLAGACGGPQALRAAGLVPALRALGLQVHNGGDLPGPARPAHSTGMGMDIRTGCHHLAQVLESPGHRRQRLERRAIRPFAGHFQRDVMPASQQFLHHQ